MYTEVQFLYSQDLSNYKTKAIYCIANNVFLYSQDLSNYKTARLEEKKRI